MFLFLNFWVFFGDDGVYVFVEGVEGFVVVVFVQIVVFVGVCVLLLQFQIFLENLFLGDGFFDGDIGVFLVGDVVVEFFFDVSVVEVVLVFGYVVYYIQEFLVVVFLFLYVYQVFYKYCDGIIVLFFFVEKKNYVIFIKKIKMNNLVFIYSMQDYFMNNFQWV